VIDRDRLVDLALRLVSTASFTGSEQAAAELVRDELDSIGLQTQWQQVEEGRANVLGTWAGVGGGPSLMFNGHLDTSYSGREPWLQGIPGFQPQGFLDAWGPVFFFAMIFAISMDYTVFLLSSAKEHWDRSHDPREAMIGGVAHSGRVILAAGAVMVAVFFTFALSGPLPPKEMGIILGIAVLLDAALIRLLLLPVLLRVMGRRAWYLPRWAHRMLPDVRFGHAS